MLYAQTYSALYQLYFNKTERKKFAEMPAASLHKAKKEFERNIS